MSEPDVAHTATWRDEWIVAYSDTLNREDRAGLERQMEWDLANRDEAYWLHRRVHEVAWEGTDGRVRIVRLTR